MEPLKVRGIVIRSTQTGDYNKMLTVLSRELGRISVWARGTKSPKHPAAASTSVLCYSEFVLNKKGDVYSLSAATLEEGFYGIRNSLDKLSYALYFASLAEKVCQEEINSEEIIRLLLNTLYYLDKGEKELCDLRLLFELKLLTYAGFAPSTNSCAVCGKASAYFDSSVGGAVCENCRTVSSDAVSVRTLELMDSYSNLPLRQTLSLCGQSETVSKALKLTEKFIRLHIGHISALDYLKSITD